MLNPCLILKLIAHHSVCWAPFLKWICIKFFIFIFSKMKLNVFFASQNFWIFLEAKLIMMRIFKEKKEEKSYQIVNYLKKSGSFTMGIHYRDKHHDINQNPMEFYN